MKKVIFYLWITVAVFLLFYSYTQIDLNLTLTTIVPQVAQIVKMFQRIGYFNRPLSSVFFLLALVLLYVSYFLLLLFVRRGKLKKEEFWKLLLIVSFILLFSYPAFSYDIFNYMFDARTIVLYHQNPWQVKPLDFPGDPWLGFMHWTHRPSVYPPVWIALTIPFYTFGLNIFLLQLFNFKLLIMVSFLISVWLLEKLLTNEHKEHLTMLTFYAFNPLMIVENVVSSHNDITMMTLALWGLWFLVKRKPIRSFLMIVLSGLVKYVSLIFLPVIILKCMVANLSTSKIYRLCFWLTLVMFFFIISKIEIQPWYFVWLFPLGVLANLKYFWPVAVGLSLGLLLRYLPFIFYGNWDPPVSLYKFWLTFIPLLISISISFWYFVRRRQYV